ncbi:gliding motility-associated C-terminal domain-containing protein [Hymenobacter sp. BT730]|uniref:gliding motility-associated C-terminal domain-containing protein n=1 Tax=Hymenobacter sp. BT730 TaxID=3063332 RepID=UPI0026E02504|nr:gliding motility-associated C-terminal domain-containing protein [Hymenobacter sp. BT730]
MPKVKPLTWFLFLLVTLLMRVGLPAYAQAPCTDTPNSGACFRVFDADTRQVVTGLCAGQRIRLRDCSGRPLDPKKTYYRLSTATVCSFAEGDTVTTLTVPATPGSIVITQNTPNLLVPGTGVIYSRTLQVYATPVPVFSVAACAPGFVQVSITDRTYDRFTVQLGNSNPQPTTAGTTTYAVSAGTTAVTVQGSYTAATLCSATSTLKFTPRATPQAPELQQLTVQGNAIEFQWGKLLSDYQYVLEVADAASPGGYRQVASVAPTSNRFTLPAASLPGCYRLRLTDACQSTGTRYVSATGCTVQLSATSADGRNELRWTTGTTATGFELTRNGTLLARTGAGTSGSYIDDKVVCGVEYTYRVAAINNTTTSNSNAQILKTASTQIPSAPTILTSFDLRNRVELTANVPASPGSSVAYTRQQAGTSTFIGAASGPLLRDSLALLLVDSPPCYTAQYLDPCGNKSVASEPACPLILEATPAKDNTDAVQLRWSAPNGITGVHQLQLLGPAGQVLRSQPVSGQTFTDLTPPADRQVLRYRLEATAPSGARIYSNIATVARPLRVTLPTAFTPNGDGLNDVLEVKGRFLTTYRLVIRDRNGQEVFQSTSPTQRWDGRINGATPVPGVYVYRFEAADELGQPFVQTGSVTILR